MAPKKNLPKVTKELVDKITNPIMGKLIGEQSGISTFGKYIHDPNDYSIDGSIVKTFGKHENHNFPQDKLERPLLEVYDPASSGLKPLPKIFGVVSKEEYEKCLRIYNYNQHVCVKYPELVCADFSWYVTNLEMWMWLIIDKSLPKAKALIYERDKFYSESNPMCAFQLVPYIGEFSINANLTMEKILKNYFGTRYAREFTPSAYNKYMEDRVLLYTGKKRKSPQIGRVVKILEGTNPVVYDNVSLEDIVFPKKQDEWF